jgi:C-terminal processing protease CtpA/Prc
MSDPQMFPNTEREIHAEGVDPDIPSTDDSTERSPDREEHDNLGAEHHKGTPPTVLPAGQDEDGDSDVLAEDPAE